ncbi:MAG: MFS transporter [Pseudomonadota bacterium]
MSPTARATISKAGGYISYSAAAMFGILLLLYAINAMDRMVFPLLASDVRKEYGFGVADTGLIATIFTLGMAVAGWPTGYLLTKFSRKAVFQMGGAIFSVGTILIACASGFADMLVYRTATGVGEAMQQISLIAIATSYFVGARSFAIATTQVAFGLGNFAGPLLASAAVAVYGGWRGAFYILGSAGLIMMIVVALAVRKSFTENQSENGTVRLIGGASNLINRNTIILTIMTLITGPILYAYLGLYSTFLREQMHFTPGDVATVMSFFGIGGLLAPIGGWLGDRFPQRRMLFLGYLALSILGYLLFSKADSTIEHSILSLLWGFAHSGVIYVNLWSAQIKTVNANLTAKASGLFISCMYATSACGGYLMGNLVSKVGWSFAAMVQISGCALLCMLLSVAINGELMSKPDKEIAE